MPKGACILTSKEFEDSLVAYSEYFSMDYEWVKFKKTEKYKVDEGDFFLLHNSIPEELKALDVLHQLHHHPKFCSLPIILVTAPLSPDAMNIYAEAEFTWQCPLPFDSNIFYRILSEVQEFMKSHRSLLLRRSKVQLALHKGEFARALEILKLIKKDYPYPYRYYLLRAEAEFGLQNFDQAAEMALKAKSIMQHAIDADTMLARIYMAQGKLDLYEEVMSSMTQKAEIHLKNLIHWGQVYVEQGETLKSMTAYERALEKDPKNIEAKEGYLAANLINGKTEVAKDILEHSAKSLQLAQLCNMKGIAMAKKGQFRSAQKLYRNAMNFLEDEDIVHKLWFNLGLCMKKKGDLEEALSLFRNCADKAPVSFKKVHDQIAQIESMIKKRQAEQDAVAKRGIVENITLDYESFIA